LLTRRMTLASGASFLAAPAVRAAGERRVRFWHSYSSQAMADAMRGLIAQFEAANSGVTVATEIVPYAAFADKWAAAQASNALPDVAALDARVTVTMALAGSLNPADDLISALGGVSAFEPGVLDMLGRHRGRYVAVPHGVNNRLLILRKDRRAAARLDLPVTWDDWLQAAAAMTKAPEYFGWVMKLSKAGYGASDLLWTMTRSAGGTFFDDDGNSLFDQPPVRDAVEFLAELARRSPAPGVADAQPSDDLALITSGRESMANATAGLIGQATVQKSPVAAQLEAVPMPIRVRVGNLLSGVCVTLPKGANPQDGRRLAEALYADSTYLPMLLTVPLAAFPVFHGKEMDFQNNAVVGAYPDAVRATLDGMATGSLPGMERGLNPYAGPVFDSHVIEDMMQAIVLNGVATQDAIADTSRKIAAILRTTKDKLGRT